MKLRIISGFALLFIVVSIVAFNSSFPLSLNIVISIISAACTYEVIKVVGLLNRWEFLIPSITLSALIPFSEIFIDVNITFILYCLYAFAMFLVLIIHHETVTFKDLTTIFAMTIIIPTALHTIVQTRSLSENHGMFYALLTLGAAWVPDIGAYFTGTFLGKHKLCPKISPKKTVEGFIGGIIFSVLVMGLVGLYFTYVYYGGEKHVNYITLILLGFGGSITSVVGDLSFSIIKRSCGVKDFGNVIPGHGGFLDRFDSVIFTAPLIYIILSHISAVV